MKKNLTGPVWFLLIIGTVFTGLLFYTFITITMTRLSWMNAKYNLPYYAWIIFWRPALMLIEAAIYWMIRKRNRYPRASWAHCGLFIFTYFMPILILIPGFFTHHYDDYKAARMHDSSSNILFWIVMLTAHAFFVWVLIQCYSKQQPAPEGPAKSENLLDDVLT